jgi:hypothetical protein
LVALATSTGSAFGQMVYQPDFDQAIPRLAPGSSTGCPAKET